MEWDDRFSDAFDSEGEARTVRLSDLLVAISEVVDLNSPLLHNHHGAVAYIAASIAAEMKLEDERINAIAAAAYLHDIGAFSLSGRLDTLNFEISHPYEHAKAGYLLTKEFPLLADVAPILLHHHTPWAETGSREFYGVPSALESQILHLADRLSVLVPRDTDILGSAQPIMNALRAESGRMFNPDIVDALMQLAGREYFWIECASPLSSALPANRLTRYVSLLDQPTLTALSSFFCTLIDFRSRFTATHTTGVAATAGMIARLAGMNEADGFMVTTGGFLHDLGKLAVPSEIIEKPGPLTTEEFNVMKRHTLYTYRILQSLGGMEEVSRYAAFHHERLNGQGYPFHRSATDLPAGARIVAVADVFTAVTEDRPYRAAMDKKSAVSVLGGLADRNELDSSVVRLAIDNYDDIDARRRAAQTEARERYEAFSRAVVD